MTDIMKFNDSVIMTIPGIGYINGGMILGESLKLLIVFSYRYDHRRGRSRVCDDLAVKAVYILYKFLTYYLFRLSLSI